MPLCEARSRNDRHGDFTEDLQQAFGGGLSRPTFGIARKQTSQLLLLCVKALAHHAFQQGENAQGKGEQAGQADRPAV